MPSLDWYKILELRIKTLEEYVTRLVSCKQEKERLIQQTISVPRLQEKYITDRQRISMFEHKIRGMINNMKIIQEMEEINAHIALHEFNKSSKTIQNADVILFHNE